MFYDAAAQHVYWELDSIFRKVEVQVTAAKHKPRVGPENPWLTASAPFRVLKG